MIFFSLHQISNLYTAILNTSNEPNVLEEVKIRTDIFELWFFSPSLSIILSQM